MEKFGHLKHVGQYENLYRKLRGKNHVAYPELFPNDY